MRSLGLFGGSFNPVHTGHVLLARYAREALKLDEIWFIPCASSADGKNLAPGALRLRWLRKVLKGEGGLKASDIELKRGGVSRTVDTLRELREKLGPAVKFTVLMGQDQAHRIASWKEAEQLPRLCRLAVFGRSGVLKREAKGFRMKHLNAPLSQISSSEIREAIGQKKNLGLLLPPALVRDASLTRAFR